MEYLEDRLLNAIEVLTAVRNHDYEEGTLNYIRLTGKIEGVKLALSYLGDDIHG